MASGKTHATLGVAVGIGTSLVINEGFELSSFVTLGTLGGVAGLIPDLDTNGKLNRTILPSVGLIKILMYFISAFIIYYSLTEYQTVNERFIGVLMAMIVAGAAMFRLNHKTIQIIAALAMIAGGVYFETLWFALLGGYMVVAALSGHRTYTHSIFALALWVYIANLINSDVQLEGIFIVLVGAYVSHLIADMKVFNKQGVKLLYPFSKFEI